MESLRITYCRENSMELSARFHGSSKIHGILLLTLMGLALGVSDGRMDSEVSSGGRHLLQAKKSCPMNTESLNYTIIASACKGPRYPANICCGAFKEFACPYADYINDLTTDCASTMFSYINIHGKYPPGLFSSECKDGKDGLHCPTSAPTASAEDAENSSNITCTPSALLTIIALAITIAVAFSV